MHKHPLALPDLFRKILVIAAQISKICVRASEVTPRYHSLINNQFKLVSILVSFAFSLDRTLEFC